MKLPRTLMDKTVLQKLVELLVRSTKVDRLARDVDVKQQVMMQLILSLIL